MKLTALLVLITTLSVSANSFSQITLAQKNAPLTSVFKELQKQSGYEFFYSYELLSRQGNVTVYMKNVSLEEAIREVLKNKPLSFLLVGKTVVIKSMPAQIPITAAATLTLPIHVKGRIFDEDGAPVLATITIKGSTIAVSSNSKGEFQLDAVDPEATLVISALNIETQEIRLNKRTIVIIQVKKKVSELDQSVVIAYGTTTKRLNTSNVTTVTAEEISRQPVFNVLQALEGRVPGMTLSQTTGVAGARMPVQIRGRANFDKDYSSDQPLFILDGVPLAANNDGTTSLTQVFGAAFGSGMSVLAGLNPNDIASIEVLKDADATAIYGSRGANGVIIITTKRGTSGKTSIDATINLGFNKVTRLPNMLHTPDYLAMRNQAFANDGIAKSNINAYDLLVWDTTRYTNLAKTLIGNTATVADVQIGASGGDRITQYRLSGNYHKEGMVWAGDKTAERAAANFNLHSMTANQRLDFNFTGTYSLNNNNFPGLDLANGIILPPNIRLYDSLGNLAWNEGGISTTRDNPLAQLRQQYIARVTNLNSNILISYKLVKGLVLRSSLGYNVTRSDEQRLAPQASLNPASTLYTGTANYATRNLRTWIIEPQVEYKTNISQGKLDVLAGGTLNKRMMQGNTIIAVGYTSDQLLTSLAGTATTNISASNTANQYAYDAFFGRINYNWRDKYIVNLTGRRDGSSRFGPEFRFSNFGAAGAAWLFSNEYFLKNVKWLSYGKLRGSYGKTGNDQIGDYQYFDTWKAGLAYYDSTTTNSAKLFNPYLHWERNNKAEVALELGFFHDRILLTTALYRNITETPLVSYPLSGVAGFSSVVTNLEGVQVENKGIEISFSSRNIESRSFKWTSNFNITVPKNQLKKYPNLTESSYAAKYQLGLSLNSIVGYQFAGVDPKTGVGSVEDQNGDSKASTANDFVFNGKTDPVVYGGFSNTFAYKRLTASVFFQFNKQMGANWYSSTTLRGVGTAYNIPQSGFQHSWQHPDEVADYPRFSTILGSLSALSGYYATYFSNRIYSDVSYIRLKNASISYDVNPDWLKKMRFSNLRVFVQGQNLLTFTKYKDADPETQNFTVLPPMKSFMGGIQLGL
ncbi:MAG: SusC/RagA family TonB-linked outer membrane protein [Niastella sp.]|uniref:SusC/RagA family TonB-linked outer membrane protein n=1 Tax=Niastella sp. TaxID=1869183 RepID=UPI003899ED47